MKKTIFSRRIAALLAGMILLMLPALSGCAAVPEETGMHIVATNFALYDFARAVAGEDTKVTLLIDPGTESHDVELTLSDIALIESCDLFLYVGGESEGWVYDTLRVLEEYSAVPAALCAMEVLDRSGRLYAEETAYTLSAEEASDHDHDHDHSHDHSHDALTAQTFAGMDEHVWTSIPNALLLVDAIEETLLSLDENYTPGDCTAYVTRLTELDARFRALTAEVGDPALLVADRFPFLYMVREYGIGYYAAFAGCAAETEPSIVVVDALIREVQAKQADTLFVIEFSDRRTAEQIAGETGAAIAELHSCHNVSAADWEAGVTYPDLMERNYTALAEAWN